MVIHITRHGQPMLKDKPLNMNREYPPEDPILTSLGRKQAQFLGRRLLVLKFEGDVISSPYRRTLETAEILAEITDTSIIPEPALQESIPKRDVPGFAGLTMEKMSRLYPRIRRDISLPYPWFVQAPETQRDVGKRTEVFIEELLRLQKKDVILVAHGVTVDACIEALLPKRTKSRIINREFTWNCSLTSIDVDVDGSVSLVGLRDISHIPKQFITSNDTSYLCDH